MIKIHREWEAEAHTENLRSSARIGDALSVIFSCGCHPRCSTYLFTESRIVWITKIGIQNVPKLSCRILEEERISKAIQTSYTSEQLRMRCTRSRGPARVNTASGQQSWDQDGIWIHTQVWIHHALLSLSHPFHIGNTTDGVTVRFSSEQSHLYTEWTARGFQLWTLVLQWTLYRFIVSIEEIPWFLHDRNHILMY